ncbi:MAG TPA: AlkA N-terminal domain-containing protein [Candidatus Dormibacteraeota bacterium]|nr:AlkA N-terminal domain-containing protein [Candidatus Dormibacteraeota bacterium]
MPSSFTFALIPVPPFALEYTAWALRRRPQNLVDIWENGTYRRVVRLEGGPAEIQVRQQGGREAARLEVGVIGENLRSTAKAEVARLLTRMLGLEADLRAFYRIAASDAKLGALAERYRGLKPVRFPTIFEALANAIACQQFTLAAGLNLLGELAHLGGVWIRTTSGVHYGFPEPADLLRLPVRTFRSIGFSRQKTNAFRELARGVLRGDCDIEGLDAVDNEPAMESLLELRGIGRWSAEYVLLRGLGRLDIFPADDVGARNGLGLWLGRRRPMDSEGVLRAVRRWRPYAGLVYFHLLLESLRAAGKLHME